MLVGGIVIILAGGAMGYSLYQFKKNSADGRFLMWRITTGIIVRHPLNGTGLGGFPSAYAQSQAEYLTGATQQEKTIAGCPEYAFNEFLQIAAEQGIPSLLIFLFWMGNIAYSAKRKRLYPILAFLLALSLFACASYPLQLPEFWILLVVFGAMAVTSKEEIMEKQSSIRQITTIAILSVFLVAGISTSVQQRKYYVAYQAWNRLKSLYQNQAYEAAEEEYRKWMPMLNHKPEFLFEAAQCYAKTGNRPGAIRLLRRAEKLSSDPMIHYVLAKNEQALGFFPEAEQTLLYAIRILPERLYPYYLLMLLYAEPDFYQPEKIYAAADSLLFKIPKTDSPAVREMQRKAKALRAK